MIAEWDLPDDLTAARVARGHVAADLARREVPESVADDILLVASELAANSIRHGRPPAVLRLDYREGRVRVTVSNRGGSPGPIILDVATDADHGRGLALVQSLADEVGWSQVEDRLDVWAEFDLN